MSVGLLCKCNEVFFSVKLVGMVYVICLPRVIVESIRASFIFYDAKSIR